MVVDETTNPSTLVFYNHDHHFSRISEARFCRIPLRSEKEGDTFFVFPVVEEMYKVKFYTEKGSAKMYIDENANLWLYKLESEQQFEGYIYVFRPDFTLLAKTTDRYTMELGAKDGILRGFMQMVYHQKTEDNLEKDIISCRKEFYMKYNCDEETGRKIIRNYE